MSQKVTHRYCEYNIGLNPGIAGVPGVYVFSANGMYDPNITGVGHQPIGFDQVGEFFDHHTVIASKLRCTFQNTETGEAQMVGIKLSDGPTFTSDIRWFIENGSCTYGTVSRGGTGGETLDLEIGCNVSKFLGRPNIMSEDDLRGSNSSNPAEQAYFLIFGGPNSTNDTAAINVLVTIEYVAIWTEPKQLSFS